MSVCKNKSVKKKRKKEDFCPQGEYCVCVCLEGDFISFSRFFFSILSRYSNREKYVVKGSIGSGGIWREIGVV